MKKIAIASLLFAGCTDYFQERADEHRLASRGLAPEDLNGVPSENDVRARITNEVRTNLFAARIDDDGKPSCDAIKWEKGAPMCVKDNVEMMTVSIRSDSTERQFPVEETGYYCPQDTSWWYHYAGGRPIKEAWMGPFTTQFKPGIKPRQ